MTRRRIILMLPLLYIAFTVVATQVFFPLSPNGQIILITGFALFNGLATWELLKSVQRKARGL